VEIERTAMDDCDFLSWTYQVYDSADTIVFEGDTNYINVILPIGEYEIFWRVEDGCGNFDVDVQYVSMLNVKAPTPVCINGLSVALIGMDLDSNGVVDAEMAELWASDFDSGSSHSCGNEIVLSFSRDTTEKNRIFDCSHLGITEVQLWVTDTRTGAQDFCRTYLEVLDNNNFDICNDSIQTVSMRGDVYDENNRMIEGVEVSLANTTNISMTDDSGQYAFENMPLGGTYEVVPKKNTDPLNGISTLDLVYIQRHILGLELITSPYKLIAADINKNNEISAIDLIELRKLILGINDEIPTNLSWRFIESNFTFVDPTNPWVGTLPETHVIEKLNSSEIINFVGVKIGDVNNSVVTSLNGEIIESRNKAIELEFDYKIDPVTGFLSADVYTKKDIDMDGMQGTFELGSIISQENLEVVSGQITISPYQFNFGNVENGWFTFSFVEDATKKLDKNDPLFTILINERMSSNLGNAIQISGRKTRSEIYSNNEIYKLRSSERTNYIETKLTAVPNPWSDQTTLSIDLIQDGNVVWNFYDVTGRLMYSEEIDGRKGRNELFLDKERINTSGIVYVKLLTREGTKELKMIVL
jgi:hypothetical protein